MVAWDYQVARIADRAGVEIVSVGDSVGVNLWGQRNPLEVTMEQMLVVAQAVRRGIARALVSVDLPFGPVQEGAGAAVQAAIRMAKEAGADLVKIDAAPDFPDAVSAVARAGIPVWAQFGVTPQTALRHGVDYQAMFTAGAQLPASMTDELVLQAQELEAAGAALLDFTNSGPAAGPAVADAVLDPGHRRRGRRPLAGRPGPDGPRRHRLRRRHPGRQARHLRPRRPDHAGRAHRGRRRRAGRPPHPGRRVPVAVVDGIATHYEVAGSGPPLLMFSPGGFNAVAANWTSFSLYERLRLLDHLTRDYTCITFDRRESGASGGRVERITWRHYAAQGKGLLEHLGLPSAHLMGGCVGCSVVATFATEYPDATRSMILYSPAGGPRYRVRQHERFTTHLAYAAEHGPSGVADLARQTRSRLHRGPPRRPVGPGHPLRPRVRPRVRRPGPSLLPDRGRRAGPHPVRPRHGARPRTRRSFYIEGCCRWSSRARTAPTPPPPRATCKSACPSAEYWDAPVAEQTAETAPTRIQEFLASVP